MFRGIVLILLLVTTRLAAQESAAGPLVSCPGHGQPDSSFADLPLRNLRLSAQPSAKFTPRYYQVPDSVKTVVEAAFGVWDKILISRVPIHIEVHWAELGASTLATAGSDRVFKNFSNAPLRDVWYPSALADALSGESVNGNNTDIVLKINRNATWNLDYTSQRGFRGYDMLSVVIHEIAHGIGFMSSFEASGTDRLKWGIQDLPFIYDQHLVDRSGNSLVNKGFYPNDSEKLLQQVTENEIYFHVDSGTYSVIRPRLHTDKPFSSGASLSHISRSQISQPDSRDRLMLPSLSQGVRYHYPGNGILAILFQMGWALNFYELEREYNYLQGSFSLFPNPGTDRIYMKINRFNPDKGMYYYLMDAKGAVLNSRQVTTEETEISLKEFPAGRYFLRVGELSVPVIKL